MLSRLLTAGRLTARTNDIALINTVCLCDTASLTRRHPQMDTYEQHTVTRLRSLLHLVFSSRSLPSELYSWCQIVFPGCCYLRYLGLHELSSWTPFVGYALHCLLWQVTMVSAAAVPHCLPKTALLQQATWLQGEACKFFCNLLNRG